MVGHPKLKILYEDDDVLAFDKPPFLVVNNSESQKDKETLEGILLANLAEYGISEDIERGGIVHRLDKETSGVILVAKNNLALKKLQSEFEKRKVKKTYLVLVNGVVKDNSFVIDAPIGRNPRNTMKHAVVRGEREAVTAFKKLKVIEREGKEFTLLEAYPKTGRTHQIRVHLLAYGHAVVCDSMYLGEKTLKENRKLFTRLMLHAKSIEFPQPSTGVTISVESRTPQELEF